MQSRPSLTLSLPALRTFEAVVRCGSMQAAARELCMTVSAISHQVAALEAAFGHGLMRKQGRRMVATEAGAALAAELAPAFQAIDRAVARTRGARPMFTVSLQPALAARWLLPRLHRFEVKARDVDLRLAAVTRLVDLDRERVDCAIRLGPGSWPEVDALPLVEQHDAPVASVALGDPAGAPRVVLEGHEDEWRFWPDLNSATPARVLQSRDLLVDAVVGGLGVGILDTVVVADAIARGELRLLRPPRPTGWRYCLVWPAGAPPSAKVVRFRDWLLEELATSGLALMA